MAIRLISERYRLWILNLVKPHTVILITARPERWKELTLQRIKQETGWAPNDAYFDDGNIRTPPAIKKKILVEKIFPKYGRGEVFGGQSPYLAIESNPKTRDVYRALGIPSVWVAPSGRKLVGESGHSKPLSKPSVSTGARHHLIPLFVHAFHPSSDELL